VYGTHADRRQALYEWRVNRTQSSKEALEFGPTERSGRTCGPSMTTLMRKGVEHGDQQHAFRRAVTMLSRTARVAVDLEILPEVGLGVPRQVKVAGASTDAFFHACEYATLIRKAKAGSPLERSIVV